MLAKAVASGQSTSKPVPFMDTAQNHHDVGEWVGVRQSSEAGVTAGDGSAEAGERDDGMVKKKERIIACCCVAEIVERNNPKPRPARMKV